MLCASMCACVCAHACCLACTPRSWASTCARSFCVSSCRSLSCAYLLGNITPSLHTRTQHTKGAKSDQSRRYFERIRVAGNVRFFVHLLVVRRLFPSCADWIEIITNHHTTFKDRCVCQTRQSQKPGLHSIVEIRSIRAYLTRISFRNLNFMMSGAVILIRVCLPRTVMTQR